MKLILIHIHTHTYILELRAIWLFGEFFSQNQPNALSNHDKMYGNMRMHIEKERE